MTTIEPCVFVNREPMIVSFADRKKLIYLVEHQNKLSVYSKSDFKKIKQIIFNFQNN